jgi:membrane protein
MRNSRTLKRLQARLKALYGRMDRCLGGVPSLLVRTAIAFDLDDGPLVARSIAYYALFSVFPAILTLIVVASSVLESEEVQESVMAVVSRAMPIVADVVAVNIERLLDMRETVGLLALVGLLWSASGVFSGLYRAVNRAWGIPKSQLVLSDRLYGLVMMFAVGTFLLLAMSIGPALSLAQAWRPPLMRWQPGIEEAANWLSALVPPLLSVSAFILMYRTMPRTKVMWRDVWLGGLVAGLIWEAGKQIFEWYVLNVAVYNLIYGSVGAVIAFLLWSYLSAQILLLGAEFTAEYSRWPRRGYPMERRPLREGMARSSVAESEEGE